LPRMVPVILAVAIAETAWALFCAATNVNLFVFYAVLVVASGIFWVPGVAEKRAPQKTSNSIVETNR
jgi:hypothetical protein